MRERERERAKKCKIEETVAVITWYMLMIEYRLITTLR